MDQAITGIIATEQSVTVQMPATDQGVTVTLPIVEQSVTVTIPVEFACEAVVPTEQAVTTALLADVIPTPPVLLSGPTVSLITQTTARVSWELDSSEAIGYHRVRHRPTAGGDWVVSAWSGSASYSAVVDLADLDPGTEYDYQVQSCVFGDGTLAFDYAPDPADTFETEAAGADIEFSNIAISKHPFLPLVVVDWDTVPDTKGKIRWRIMDSGDGWVYTSLTLNYSDSHSQTTGMQCTPDVYYEYQLYGIDEGDYEEWDILRFIKITAEGLPEKYVP